MSGKYRTGLSRVETGAIGLRSLNVPSANVILITDTIHRFAHNWLQPSEFDFCRSIHSFNLSEVPVRPGVSASAYAQREVLHASIHGVNLALVLFSLTILRGCERLVPRDTQSLSYQDLPDRRSSASWLVLAQLSQPCRIYLQC